MRTLQAITDELPILKDKLALMYADIAAKSKKSFHLHKDDFLLANRFLRRLEYELTCGQDLELINFYYNKLNEYLKLCKNVAYEYVCTLMPKCEADRERLKYWIIGDSMCEDSGTIYVDAGPDSEITFPTSQDTLSGTATDTVNGIASTVWQLISGPNTPSIISPSNLTTLVTSLIPGTYNFKLLAVNNIGQVGYDEKKIKVLGLPVIFFTVQWGYFDEDPTVGVENKILQFSVDYPPGVLQYDLDFTHAANEKFLVVKEPVAQPVKTEWTNTNFNNGNIPDSVFKSRIVIGAYAYTVSRIPVVIDSTNSHIIFE